MTRTSTNPYLDGNFRPVREEVTITDLEVTGTIPPELDGRYLRNGPNPITDPDPATHHWFAGTGMVHGIRLRDGRAEWYRNRYPRTGDVAPILGVPDAGGAAPHGGFDFAPNTNVIGHAGRYFAIVEAGARPVELDGELGTVGRSDFGGTLPNGYSAHPHRDPLTGELHTIAYWWGFGNQVQHIVVDATGAVTKTLMVPTHASPMVHDCALTPTYVAVFDFPVAFDMEMAAAGRALPYRWFDDAPCRVGLLPRSATDAAEVRWFDIEPCYVYHPLNAYDDGDTVVIDVVRHRDTFRDGGLAGGGAPTLWRWTFDVPSGQAKEEQLFDHRVEFPRADERRSSLRHRFGYAPATSSGGGFDATTTLQFDLDRGQVAVHDHGPGRHPGEFVFVPAEGSAAEDDGYLVGLVHDDATETAALEILSAQAIDQAPIATVHLPVRVPYGFHGNWVPEP
jgi:carotenoid cleavage dioxygenase